MRPSGRARIESMAAERVADECQNEIDIWHACADFYGYEFIVLRTANA